MRNRLERRAQLAGWVLLCALTLQALPQEAAAQSGFRFDLTAGGLWTDGDDQCDPSLGAGAGAQVVGTAGVGMMAIALDVLTTGKVTCSAGNVGHRNYQGEQVDILTSVGFLAPRLSLRAGLTLDLGGLVLDPALAVGIMPIRTHYSGPEEWIWPTWLGGVLQAHPRNSRLGVLFEYGLRQAPVRYRRGTEIVHEFMYRLPMVRLVMTL